MGIRHSESTYRQSFQTSPLSNVRNQSINVALEIAESPQGSPTLNTRAINNGGVHATTSVVQSSMSAKASQMVDAQTAKLKEREEAEGKQLEHVEEEEEDEDMEGFSA